MDWFSWLSKARLEPSLIYEYGLALSHNELEYEDVVYFNHEFLQSIGISIGKHRLEILKLAKKEKRAIPNSMSRFLQVIKRTKRCFSKYIRNWGHSEELALVLVPKRNVSSSSWKNTMLKRNKRVAADKQSPLLITNVSPNFVSDSRMNSLMVNGDKMGDDYWGVEEIRSKPRKRKASALYSSIGCAHKREMHLTKPEVGHFRAHDVPMKRKLKEFAVTEDALLRALVSTILFPARRKMPGRNELLKMFGATAYKIDPARSLMWVKVQVPGAEGDFVFIKD